MAICPAGHQTTARDFCDTCGLPVPAGAPATALAAVPEPSTPVVSGPVICPNCKTPNVADALFCEACGYDFTTGSMPDAATVPAVDTAAPVTAVEQVDPVVTEAVPEPAEAPEVVADAPVVAGVEAAGPATAVEDEPAAAADTDAPEAVVEATPEAAEPEVPEATETAASAPAEEAAPVPVVPLRPVVDWVAELWIDPDWYTAQGSSDPMPSPSLPDIVPLVKQSNLIGRVSHSRGIFPDIDCELDSGCSRRHAMLSTDGGRWWIEDLDSANGTFVGAAAGPLPGMPIPQGRVELNPGQRIYVGAWTRIVVRRATEDEKVAFA
jgi:hypothetical protein